MCDSDVPQVKRFLLNAKLPDPRPLIRVCDRHGFIEEMVDYLYRDGLQSYIEVRVVCALLVSDGTFQAWGSPLSLILRRR